MQLALSPPPAWSVRSAGTQYIATVDEHDGRAEVVLEWGSLIPLPDDVSAWITRALHTGVTDSARVELGTHDTRTTTTGWPLRLVDARVVLADGTTAEHRLAVFYTFLEYGAVALVCARSGEALEGVLADLARTFATGAPDWQADGRPVSVHDLFR